MADRGAAAGAGDLEGGELLDGRQIGSRASRRVVWVRSRVLVGCV